jgi:hypothetical protein
MHAQNSPSLRHQRNALPTLPYLCVQHLGTIVIQPTVKRDPSNIPTVPVMTFHNAPAYGSPAPCSPAQLHATANDDGHRPSTAATQLPSTHPRRGLSWTEAPALEQNVHQEWGTDPPGPQYPAVQVARGGCGKPVHLMNHHETVML